MANDPKSLSAVKAASKPLATNTSASVWDVGDEVACLEFHSKMNTIDLDTMAMGMEAVAIASSNMRALLIHNEAKHFCAGANLGLFLSAASAGDWDSIDNMIALGQAMMQAFKFSPIPVVAAPGGLALGGGCEVLLHCAAVQAHTSLSTGLVEPLVGLIPGWGGCKEMLIRKGAASQSDTTTAIIATFEQITSTKTSKSAVDAKELGYLRTDDGITMNSEQLFADAKTLALRLAENYQPPRPVQFGLPWSTAHVALLQVIEADTLSGKALPHDVVICQHLARVLSGGEVQDEVPLSESEMLGLEKRNFVALCRTQNTIARIEAMLTTGKPLRN